VVVARIVFLGRGPVFYECKSPARRDPDEPYSAVLKDFKKR
jgi:hypothetical protein